MHIVTTPKRLNDDCSICQPQQEHCELLPIWWCWIKELFNSYMFLKCNDMFWPVRYSILGVSLFSTLKFSSENAHCNLALNAVGFGAKKPFLFVTGQCGIGESHGSRLLFWKSHVWVYIILILTYIYVYIDIHMISFYVTITIHILLSLSAWILGSNVCNPKEQLGRARDSTETGHVATGALKLLHHALQVISKTLSDPQRELPLAERYTVDEMWLLVQLNVLYTFNFQAIRIVLHLWETFWFLYQKTLTVLSNFVFSLYVYIY